MNYYEIPNLKIINMNDIIAVTGASGFIGAAICERLESDGCKVRKLSRFLDSQRGLIAIGEIDGHTSFREALKEVSVIIHCAGRAHIMNEQSTDVLRKYRLINVEATLNLARQAAEIGVKRFIFLSSIKVNGEWTKGDSAFTPQDLPDPRDPYAISKYEAELGLKRISEQSGMEIVIIRPPLVYGPNVKANFSRMINLIPRIKFFPLGAIKNKRSYIFLDNLIDLIILCMTHPAAANEVFLASDCQDISTPDLIRSIGFALSRSVYLIPVPVCFLRFLFSIFGRKDIIIRICFSLRVDVTKSIEMLGWKPKVSLDEGLLKTVSIFNESKCLVEKVPELMNRN
ncbi:NAD-dependent epimerase/dehydratase family protein [Polynucleobacter difficilis]|uniref:NAD-dependent epimerase/dehydratase family protein n=1 Tax=Polynucleobacter difficilis TaxID=556054 RepID=UPI000D3B9D43|nr:NAD-dependent epimerase/dehydratase family protein [Polynucleobacter difficilis]